jgi:type IV pilus assembly protein PilM
MSTVVALDIGSSSIAGVELKTARERVTLTKAAVEPLPPGLVHDGEIVRPDELAGEIKRFWRTARFSGKRVRLGVANQRVVVRTIELPALEDDRERRAAVEFEAAEQIPIPPDQTVVDSQPVLRFSNEAGDRERHVVVAAHRDMVDGLVATVRQAGLQPVGIDLEAFAILRALLAPPPVIDEGSQDTGAVAVCHVGAEVTNMIVAVDRRCHFTRLVGFGGSHLTKAVSERTGLPAEEAEAVKTACGLLGDPLDGWDADTVAEVRHALALGARPLVREISRSLDYYRGQSFARPIDRLVISGGTSLCAGIDRYLQQGLGLPVEIGDPRRQLDDSGDMDGDVAARAAVALGLALDAPERS